MNPLQLIMVVINGLSVLTNNPALGGGSSLKLQEASELLSLLSELVTRGEEGYRELVEFANTISTMVEENRAPTPAEWDTLKARSDAASDVIQNARRRAEQEEAEAREAEAARQLLSDEASALEDIPEEDRTDEQSARLAELKPEEE